MKLFGAELHFFFQRSIFVLQVKEMRLASTMLFRKRSWWECSLTIRQWGLYSGESFWMKAHRYQALQVQLDQKLPVTICSTRWLHLDLIPAVCLKTGTCFFKLPLSKWQRGHCKFKARIQLYGLALSIPEVWWELQSGSLQSDLSSKEELKVLPAEMEIPLLGLCFGTLQVPRLSPPSP